MITERELREAIAECQGQRNPNADTCKKLASYYIILDKLTEKTEKPSYSYSAEKANFERGSEFSDIIRGKDTIEVLEVMDELMDALRVLSPKLYNATLAKLSDL